VKLPVTTLELVAIIRHFSNAQSLSNDVIVILIVMYLFTLHILILLRIGSEERMVFRGGHPAKY
jgi:hypothetical protein